MVTWAEVSRWEPAPLQSAVGTINAEYNKLVPASVDLRKLTTPHGWTGHAAEAAANRVTQIVDRLEAWAAELEAARTAATNVGDAIVGVRRGADEAVHLAASQNFTIADDGAVHDNGPVPPPPDQADAVANERRATLAELADRVRQVLLSADDVDNDFCTVLDRLLQHSVYDSTTNDNSATSLAAAGALGIQAGGLTIPPPPAEGATAAQNAAYWATLSDQQHKQLAMDHPNLVGPRDGFTTEHRDIANRKIFQEERGALQRQRDDLRSRLNGLKESDPREMNEYHDVEDQIAALDEKLGGMAQIEQRLNDPNKPPAYLLGIDSDNAGRAIIASGNPDTSANVATFVPGTTAGIPDIAGNIDRSDQMLLAAESAGSESTSVITWIGYDAPQSILPDAADTTFADNAEQPLHSFQDGLHESHLRPEEPHTTVIGHSYGSTAVGQTARDQGIAADDLIFAGSPGVGVDHANQLRLDGVPPDQVGSRIYATAAPTDPIPIGTNFRSPELDGVDPLGPDPTTQWFGGQTFDPLRQARSARMVTTGNRTRRRCGRWDGSLRESKRRLVTAAATTALLGAVMAGCGDDQVPSEDGNQPTITEPQAAELADRYVRELVTALPPTARLEEQGKLSSQCPDESGTGFGKRVRANSNYWVRDLDPAQYNAHFDAMKAWLGSHGWVVQTDDRPEDMFLNAYREQDKFTMSLQANKKGGLTLGAASPCVWPNGTPQ